MTNNVHEKSKISKTFGSAIVHIAEIIEDLINRSFSRSDNIKSLFESGLEAAFSNIAW